MRRMHWERIAQHCYKAGLSATKARKLFKDLLTEADTTPPPWEYTDIYGQLHKETSEQYKRRLAFRLQSLSKYEDRFVRWVLDGPPKHRRFPKQLQDRIRKAFGRHNVPVGALFHNTTR